MAFEETLAELEGLDLTEDQYRKLQEVKRLAQEKGYLKSINPAAQPNPRNEQIRQTPAPPSMDFLTQDLPDIGAATAGGMAGAQYAAKLPLPGILKPIGVGIGGVIGATGGLTALRGARTSIDQGTPVSLDQIIAEAKQSGIEAGTGEAAGGALRLLGRGAKGLTRMALAGRKGTPDELKTFSSALDKGVSLRPADVTGSSGAMRIEQSLRQTQGGSDIFKKRDMLNQKNFEQAYNTELADTVASRMDSQERGQLIRDVIQHRVIPEYQEMARKQASKLTDITGNKPIIYPDQTFQVARELLDSIRADANPRLRGVAKKIMEMVSQPGMQTGLKVRRATETLPGSSRLTGLSTKVTSSVPGEVPTTGLKVATKRGQISPEDQALEDLGGKQAMAPLEGLKITKMSEGASTDIPTGLKVAPRYEEIPGKDVLAGLKAEVTSRLPDRPKHLTFAEAHEVRSLLGELGQYGEALPGKAAGQAREMRRILGLEMEQGALKFQQSTGVPLVPAWKRLDQLVREEGHELFDANVITKTLKATPEDVVRETFKPGNLTEVQQIIKALKRTDDPEALNQWRRGVLEHLWSGGTLKTGARRGEFSGSALADEIAKYDPKVVKAALGDAYPKFAEFLAVASRMDPKSSTGMGMGLIDKGLLFAAPVAGITGALLHQDMWPMVGAGVAGASYLIGTRQLAKMLNNPKSSEKLLQAMRAKPGTEVWSRALAQLAAIEALHE